MGENNSLTTATKSIYLGAVVVSMSASLPNGAPRQLQRAPRDARSFPIKVPTLLALVRTMEHPMKNRFLAAIMILGFLALTLTGCTNDVDEYVGIFEGAVAVAEEHKGECSKQEAALAQYLEENRDKIATISKKIQAKDKGSRFSASQEKAIETAIEDLNVATEGCPNTSFVAVGLVASIWTK